MNKSNKFLSLFSFLTDCFRVNEPKTDSPKTDPLNSDPPNSDPPNTDPPNTDPPNSDPPNSDPKKPIQVQYYSFNNNNNLIELTYGSNTKLAYYSFNP